MTKEQIFGILRHTMTAVGGILIAKGFIGDVAWTELTGAALKLVGVVWSIVDKKKTVK
jgi:hypothetical protein